MTNLINIISGGFVGASNIISNQALYGKTMLQNFDEEQKNYFEKRLIALNNYLGAAPSETSFDSLKDENIIETFMKALTDNNPKEIYKVQSWRYMFYYTLLKMPLPESIGYWIIKKFISFPEA
jgi:hypothetical protein